LHFLDNANARRATAQMNTVLAFGCLSLVLLRTLQGADLKSHRIKRCLAAWLAGLFAGAFVIYQAQAALGYIHLAYGLGYLKYNIQRIRENKDKLPANIVLIDGGSCAARAINYKLLEKILSARGYSVMALQFSKPGAPHIERKYGFEQFAKFIGPQALKRMNKKNVVFLREVHLSYDMNPIAQFTGNYYTNSALAYLRPGNAWLALRAAWQCRNQKVTATAITPETMVELAKHGLANAFNIGAAYRFMPMQDVPASDPVFDLGKKVDRFKYCGPSLNTILATSTVEPLNVNWQALVDDQLAHLGLKFKPAYFAIPSLYAPQMAYCKSVTGKTPYLTFTRDPAFLSKFDNPQSWYDEQHLLRSGCELYTAWLADQIIAQGLLTPGRPGQHKEVLAVQAREDLAGTRSHREISKP
jgi:hypothetical protein